MVGREGTCFHQGSLHVELFAGTHLSSWVAVWYHTRGCLVVSSALDLHSAASFKLAFCNIARVTCLFALADKLKRK